MPWPRTCSSCDKTTWQNPIPVAVLLVPLTDHYGKYLGVRRAIQPALGQVVLPSGFMETPNTRLPPEQAERHWAYEAAREFEEETGTALNPNSLRLFSIANAPSNPANLLLFIEAPPMAFADILTRFVPNEEVSELVPISPDAPIPWSTHGDAMRAHLATHIPQKGSCWLIAYDKEPFTVIEVAEDPHPSDVCVDVNYEDGSARLVPRVCFIRRVG